MLVCGCFGREQRLPVAKVFIEVAPLRERRAVQEPLAPSCRRRDERAATLIRRSLENPAQFAVTGERIPKCLRKGGDRFSFPCKKVLEETRRSTHGLARIIEYVVEARQSLEEKPREELDTWGVPQIETVNLQTPAKCRKIPLLRIPVGSVDGKARGHDDVCTGPQKFEGCLKSNLDPSAGDERIVSTEVSCLGALGIIVVSARVAKRVVVSMHSRKGLFAHVAGEFLMQHGANIRMFGIWALEPERCVNCGAALDAQPCLLEEPPVVVLRGLALGAPKCLRHLHQIVPLGLCDESRECQ